jgi:PAS domain S-box-containing protein
LFAEPPTSSPRLYAEQVKLLYAQAPAGLMAALVNGVVLTIVLWTVSPPWKLILWFALVSAAVCLRYWLLRLYRGSHLKDAQVEHWGSWFIVGLFASGSLMGSAGIFLLPVHSLPHKMFVAFVLSGMVAGAAGYYSVMFKGFLIYSLPVIAPITIYLLHRGTEIEVAIGGLLLVFYAIMVHTAYHVHKTTISSLWLRFENSDLVAHLMAFKSQAEEAIAALEQQIAERKNAEKALQERERLFRMLVETMNDGLGLQNEEGIITYVNEKFCTMLGYDATELVGRRMLDLFDGENRSRYEQQQMHRHGAQTAYEIEMLQKNGGKISTIISASPVCTEGDGRCKGSIAAITDISVLKRAERELRESEEKYRLIFENSPLGIVHFGLDGRITAYNENLARISDSSRVEFIGLNPLHYLQDEAMKCAIAACIAGKQTRYEGCYRSRRTGRITPIKADFSPILARDGSILGGIGIIQDISRQKRAEKELGDKLHFLQTLIDTIPNPIFYKDPDGRYVGCNKAFADRLGLNRNEIVGKSAYDVLPQDLADEYQSMDAHLFAHPGEQVYETSLVYSDGT